jgi:hypothetical protein
VIDAKLSPVRMAVRDILPLMLQIKDAVGENEAADLLGLPLSVLPDLADRGLIKRLEGPIQGLVPGFRGYHKIVGRRSHEEGLVRRRPRPRRVPLDRHRRAIDRRRRDALGGRHLGHLIRRCPGLRHRRRAPQHTLQSRRRGRHIVRGRRKHLHGTAASDELPEQIAHSTAAELLKVGEAFLWRLVKLRSDLLQGRGSMQTVNRPGVPTPIGELSY